MVSHSVGTSPLCMSWKTLTLLPSYSKMPMFAELGSLFLLKGPMPVLPKYWIFFLSLMSALQASKLSHFSPPSAPETEERFFATVSPLVLPPC